MVRRKSSTKIFNDDDYLDASGNYTAAPNSGLEVLNRLLTESKEIAQNKELELKEIENDKTEIRAARVDALKTTREANYFSKQVQDKIKSASELGYEGFLNPPEPPEDDNYTYKYKWHTFPGGGGEYRLIRFPKYNNPGLNRNFGPGPGPGLETSLISRPTPSPTPPEVTIPVVPPPPPKTAPIDTILFDDESVPIEIMSDMIFEDIGGHEIINIARNDTVNGQTVSYQPIKNLTSIQQQYNPNNIVALQDTSQKYFENFSIKLETKLPAEGGGGGPDGAYVYIEQSTGDLIVELINLEPDEQIEVEIRVSGTIYEAEFNES